MCRSQSAMSRSAGDGRPYNAAVTLRDGRILNNHRKINLPGYGRLEEARWFSGGSAIDSFGLAEGWCACTLICADVWNPALVHIAACHGAMLLLVPISSSVEAVGDGLRQRARLAGRPRFLRDDVRDAGPDGQPRPAARAISRAGAARASSIPSGARSRRPPRPKAWSWRRSTSPTSARRGACCRPCGTRSGRWSARSSTGCCPSGAPAVMRISCSTTRTAPSARRSERSCSDELAPRAAAIEDRDDWTAIKHVVRALGEAGYLTLMFARPLSRHAGAAGADARDDPVGGSRLSQLRVRDHDRDGAELRLPAAPLRHRRRARASPSRHPRRPQRRRHLRDRAPSRLRHVAAADDDRVRRGPQRVGDQRPQALHLERMRSPTSTSSMASIRPARGERRPLSAVVVPRGRGRASPFRGATRSWAGAAASSARSPSDDCRVPADHLLGERGAGLTIMVGMFNFERIILGGSGLGVARSAFDIAAVHAQSREAFGDVARLQAADLGQDRRDELAHRRGRAADLPRRQALRPGR